MAGKPGKGGRPKGGKKFGGRKKGTPNKVSGDVREALKLLAECHVRELATWMKQIRDPARRIQLFIDLLEYTVPKLGRMEHTGPNGGPIQQQTLGIQLDGALTDEDAAHAYKAFLKGDES